VGGVFIGEDVVMFVRGHDGMLEGGRDMGCGFPGSPGQSADALGCSGKPPPPPRGHPPVAMKPYYR
jgi:hypothetical protein